MTDVYFVRHCQSQKEWKDNDSIRPLTKLGPADSVSVAESLRDVKLDYCICSPYIRSMDTIRSCAEDHKLEIHTDTRFGERIIGPKSDENALIMRWKDHDYNEEGGECIRLVQQRNIEGLHTLITEHAGESILFGTHGTALSTIINYYEHDFGYEGFKRLYDWMPYIIHAVFNGVQLVSREEILIINRGY